MVMLARVGISARFKKHCLFVFFQVFLDNLGIGLTIAFIVGVSILIVVLKIIFIDPPFM